MSRALQAFIVSLLLLTATSSADIGLSLGFYNSRDDLSVGMVGEDLNFEGAVALMPDSFNYENGGRSTGSEGHYSYSIIHNGDPIESGVSTDSGFFSWNARAQSDRSESGQGGGAFSVSARSGVVNGTVKIHFANPYTEVDEDVTTRSAAFYEMTSIDRTSIVSSARGATVHMKEDASPDAGAADGPEGDLPDDLEDEPVTKGIQHDVSVRGVGKSSDIATDVEGMTEFVWKSGVISTPSGYTSGVSIMGVLSGSMEGLGMIGEATGFPTQVLPPGEIEINWTTAEHPISDAGIEDFSKYVREEMEDFISKYPGPMSDVLNYSLEEETEIDPHDGGEYRPSGNYTGRYSMRMKFDVGER